MSYTNNGVELMISSPIQSISVNKLNLVVHDKNGSQLIKFDDVNQIKCFLTWLYQA